MAVLLFAPRFHDPVRSGVKRQTIRNPRVRPVRAGDSLSLRGWTGTPYRSPQFVLMCGVCGSVEPVRIGMLGPRVVIEVSGVWLPPHHVAEFVRDDGFADAADFVAYRGMSPAQRPFKGVLIRWVPAPSPFPSPNPEE